MSHDTNNQPDVQAVPFFARFLESQGSEGVEYQKETLKYPSDSEEISTTKYPSDYEED